MTAIEFPGAGLTDGIVGLRLMGEEDVETVTAACQDPEIQRWTTVPSPYTERDAREWLRHSRLDLEAGTGIHTLIVASSEQRRDEVVGTVGIAPIDPFTRRAQGGYWLAAGVRGQGFVSRALRLLCGFVFDELGVARVELWIEPENLASLRVAERSGFAREGLMRSFMPISGERRDMLMYALLAGSIPPGAGRAGEPE